MAIIKEKEEALISNLDLERKLSHMNDHVEKHDRILEDVNEAQILREDC